MVTEISSPISAEKKDGDILKVGTLKKKKEKNRYGYSKTTVFTKNGLVHHRVETKFEFIKQNVDENHVALSNF